MEAVIENRYAVAAVLLFGIGFCVVLLKQNLVKKVLGLNVMVTGACWLLAELAPAGEAAADTGGLMMIGIVTEAAMTAFSLALIWRIYRRYGTVELKELLGRVRGEDE